MDKYIPLIVDFDLSRLKGNGHLYEKEIDKIRGLYAVLCTDLDSGFSQQIRCCDRGVYPKQASSHMGLGFSAQTRLVDCVLNKHNIYMISVGKDRIFYSFVKDGEDKNNDAYLDPLLFPEITVIPLNIGVKYKELMDEAERINLRYSYSVIRDAVELLSGVYREEIKEEWGRAIVILLTVTCEAVRSFGVCEFIKAVLNDETDTPRKMPPKEYKEINLWGKISDVAYKKRKPFGYHYTDDENVTHTQMVKNLTDVAGIFAVIKAPPSDDHPQAKHQKQTGALTLHHTYFPRTSTVSPSMKDMCSDQSRMSKEEKDPNMVKGKQEPTEPLQLACDPKSEPIGEGIKKRKSR